MKCGRIAGAAALLTVFALLTHDDARAGEPKASIELFTSQGCSSCPPADKLIGELALNPSLVVMSLAIDYWDYLGWKDTLALKGHGKRQHAYARVRGDREVYTPQVVVNGLMQVPGGDRSAIERAIEVTRRDAHAMRLPIVAKISGDELVVNVPAAPDGKGQGEVWLCPITKKIAVAIERGENRGQTITYSNVVRRWVKLGDWTGKAETYTLPTKNIFGGEIDSVAVLVQNGAVGAPGTVLGAAIASPQ